MYDVICVGCATQDVFVSSDQTCLITLRSEDCEQQYLAYEYGGKLAVDELFISTGGGASNTAISFSRLGLKVAAICELGEDDAGHMVERHLAEHGIDTRMLTHSPDLKTGYSVILVGPTGDRTVLVHRGAGCTLTKPEVAWDTVKQTKWLYLASLSGESAGLWDDFAAFASEHGIRLAINPGSQQLKRGMEGMAKILAATDFISLNRREAFQLTGVAEKRGEEDERAALQALVAAGCKMAVMTMGAQGAMAYDGHEYVAVAAPQVKVVSNLGAGDAFSSGVVAALQHGLSLREALEVGSLNSGSVVGVMGATEGLLDWETVEKKRQA